jgi:hypothetical protein
MLYNLTISGGGYFIQARDTGLVATSATTFGPPAGAINSYLIDGAASAGPLPLIGATNATIS